SFVTVQGEHCFTCASIADLRAPEGRAVRQALAVRAEGDGPDAVADNDVEQAPAVRHIPDHQRTGLFKIPTAREALAVRRERNGLEDDLISRREVGDLMPAGRIDEPDGIVPASRLHAQPAVW